MSVAERHHHPGFLRTKGQVLDGRVTQFKMQPKGFYELWNRPMTAMKALGLGAVTGATGDVNCIHTRDNTFEYHIKGTQTILCPTITTAGLNVAMDQTAADGIEITPGILADNRLFGCFKVGTDDSFYVRCKVTPADTSGANPLLVGFRKAEAYQATYTNYADYSLLGIKGTANPNTIFTSTNLAAGGNTDTNTNLTWADGITNTLEVVVSGAGVATQYLNGALVTTAPAFTFASGSFLIPMFLHIQAADLDDTCPIVEWECGYVAANPIRG